ncbi:MAG: Gfo/Idh/MocA family oxidoreductase [Cyclobacteriaceae bacterium]
MKDQFLVIGLGSMGKRRIRNLIALGFENVVGHDVRQDRCNEASAKYSIETFVDINLAFTSNEVKAFIISVPPDQHCGYMNLSIEKKIPAFIEASVVDTNFDELIELSIKSNVLLAPSCTLHFHPAIKKISEIVNKSELGKISNFLYHSGQYLPDWHSYEKVSDYYVSKKETGGGREIVPFELTWITSLLGFPQRVLGLNKKTIEIEGAETIDDTYNLLLDYGDFIFNLSVDVVSRFATRRLVINGDKKQLTWNWEDDFIRLYDPKKEEWEQIGYETISAEDGYNKNITEQMYIEEMDAFVQAISNQSDFPNSVEKDHKVLKILYAAEKSDLENTIQFL